MKSKFFLTTIVAIFLTATTVLAYDFGSNITIYDGSSSELSGWHGKNEDQEVEPGDATGQVWDLEGFFLDGSSLTMVGGFDFINGVSGYSYESGDIFIDTDGNYTSTGGSSSNGYENVNSNFGYEYVLDMDFANGTYDVYALSSDDTTVTVYYSQNDASNPFRYVSGGETVLSGLSFGYLSGLSDNDTGLLGDTHNAVTVDIGFLAGVIPGEDFTAHFTIGCGNDNLMGKGTAPVPEPTTILLSGLGLLGMGFLLRRKHNHKLAR